MGNEILIPYTTDRKTLVGIKLDIFFKLRYIIRFDQKGQGKLFVSIALFHDSLIVCRAFDCRKRDYFGKWCPFCNNFNPFNGRRIYPFNKGLRIYGGVYHPPFDTFEISTSTDDIKLKLYR